MGVISRHSSFPQQREPRWFPDQVGDDEVML